MESSDVSCGANNNLPVKSLECKRNMITLRVKYEKNVVSMITICVKCDIPMCHARERMYEV